MAALKASFHLALKGLKDAVYGKETRDQVDTWVTDIEAFAAENGLEPDDIVDMMDVACKLDNKITVTLRRRLVRTLLPRTTVPATAVVRAIAKFNLLNFDKGLKIQILKWLLVVFDYVDDKDVLHSLYTVLMFFVEYEALMPYVCHLLYLLTRRQDVTTVRVQRLLKLRERCVCLACIADLTSQGPDPSLVALLGCYRQYNAALVALVVSSTRKRWFPPLDAKLQEAVQRVQAAAAVPVPSSHKAKRSRLEGAITMQRDTGAAEVLKAVDRLELPPQIAEVLRNRGLQRVLANVPNTLAFRRLEHWLSFRLSAADLQPGRPSTTAGPFLESLHSFCEHMQETTPAVDAFLAKYLRRWSGVDHRRIILRLVALAPPRPFEGLYLAILKPLYSMFATMDLDFQIQCLNALAELTRRFAAHGWQTHFKSDSPPVVHHIHGALVPADYLRGLSELVRFMAGLCGLASAAHPLNVRVQDAVLTFYETATKFCERYGLPIAVVPPLPAVYCAALGSTPVMASRLCGILARCKTELDAAKMAAREPVFSSLSYASAFDDIVPFNTIILDLVNLLWRNRTLTEGTERSNLFGVPLHIAAARDGEDEDVRKERVDRARTEVRERRLRGVGRKLLALTPMQESLSISHGTFSGLALQFLESKKGSAKDGSLRPSMIKSAARVEYLDFLQQKGLHGLHTFLHAFVGSLLKRATEMREDAAAQ